MPVTQDTARGASDVVDWYTACKYFSLRVVAHLPVPPFTNGLAKSGS